MKAKISITSLWATCGRPTIYPVGDQQFTSSYFSVSPGPWETGVLGVRMQHPLEIVVSTPTAAPLVGGDDSGRQGCWRCCCCSTPRKINILGVRMQPPPPGNCGQHAYSTPGAYCINIFFPEKNSGYFNRFILTDFFFYGKVNGKNHANLSFQILPEFFSGKIFMQWAPGGS